MRLLIIQFFLISSLLISSCSEAQSLKNSESPVENNSALTKLGTMPRKVSESSGLAGAGKADVFYTMGDAGNAPVLFKINAKGEVLEQIKIPVRNNDWESLAQDNRGNLYIGDFGNNNNTRKDLVIYKVKPDAPDDVQSIKFSYPDQQDFPPKKKDRNFDCEASVWHNGAIYLFSRDRGRQKISNVYMVPDQAGEYIAKKVGELKIDGQVSGADLNQSANKLVLIGHEKIYILKGKDFESILKSSAEMKPIKGAGQTEGILFSDDSTLIITSEQGGLYKYKL